MTKWVKKTIFVGSTERLQLLKIFLSISLIVLFYSIKGQNPSIHVSDKIDSLISITNSKSGEDKARGYHAIALLYHKENYYAYSLEYTYKALELAKELQLKLFQAQCYLLIGATYERSGDFLSALEFTKIARNGFRSSGHAGGLVISTINLALIYSHFDNLEKFEELNFEAIKKAKQIGDTIKLAMAYSNYSFVLFEDGQYQRSLIFVDSGLTLLQNIQQLNTKPQYISKKISLQINLLENLIALKQFKTAEVVIHDVFKHKSQFSIREMSDVSQMLTLISIINEDYDGAIKHLKLERLYKDSLDKIEHAQEIIDIKIKNEVRFAEQENKILLTQKNLAESEIIQLEDKNEIAHLRISKQKSNLNLLIVIVFAIGAISLVLTYFFYMVRNKNRDLVERNLIMLASNKDLLLELSQVKDKPTDTIEHLKKEEVSVDQINEIIEKLNTSFVELKTFKQKSLTLNSLAKQLGTNRTYLSKTIKEISPLGFLDFVNEFRIKESWKMLSNPDCFHLTIEHISQEVGFKSQPTFNKAFKKFTGVTPSFYLKEVKRKLSQ